MATIEDCKATIVEQEEIIVAQGTELAGLDTELANATGVREAEHKTFESTEKELVDTVDQMGRALVEIKKGMSFMQIKGAPPQERKRLRALVTALSKIADAAWVTEGNKKVLKSFLQGTQKVGDDDDLTLKQPQ